LASACLNYPRNGQSLATKTTVVQFEGFYYATNIEITLWIWNNSTSAWEVIPHAPITSGGSGITDNAGDTWYYYAADDVVLPQGAQYWAAGAGRNVSAKVKATGPSNYDLTTYDVNADDCINQYKPQGGSAIMQHCKSSASPAVTLNVPCGAASGICCLASPACDFGQNCSSGTCSSSCGAQGQTCCQAGPGCGGSTVCHNNSCVHCGSTGESCCANSACSSGNVCKGGSCVGCGGQGEVCCANNACASSANVCKGGSCVACGGQGQPCCGGNSCGNGLTCSGGSCVVPPCGGAYQACCANDTCPGSTNAQPVTCETATHQCMPCGNAGQSCCFLNVNPPYGCNGVLSCMNNGGGYQCACDINFYPNGCG
jgi:hypothetical protein